MPLVSRRFRNASRDPAAWPELKVSHTAFSTEARWMSFLRWLVTVGSGLHSLVFEVRLITISARACPISILYWARKKHKYKCCAV